MSHTLVRDRARLANRDPDRSGLVRLAFGNVSRADHACGVMAIKASGVACIDVRREDVVLVDLATGHAVEPELRPSSDTLTHLALYRANPGIGGIVPTHSTSTSSWAQAERAMRRFGATHADHFHGPLPVTRRVRPSCWYS